MLVGFKEGEEEDAGKPSFQKEGKKVVGRHKVTSKAYSYVLVCLSKPFQLQLQLPLLRNDRKTKIELWILVRIWMVL